MLSTLTWPGEATVEALFALNQQRPLLSVEKRQPRDHLRTAWVLGAAGCGRGRAFGWLCCGAPVCAAAEGAALVDGASGCRAEARRVRVDVGAGEWSAASGAAARAAEREQSNHNSRVPPHRDDYVTKTALSQNPFLP